MIRQWKLKKPDIVISLHGGLKNFKLDPHHKEIFNRGLIKAAKTTHSGAWIITGNTDGLVKHNFMKQIFTDKGTWIKKLLTCIRLSVSQSVVRALHAFYVLFCLLNLEV